MAETKKGSKKTGKKSNKKNNKGNNSKNMKKNNKVSNNVCKKCLEMHKDSCPYKPREVLTEKQAMEKKVGSFYHPTKKTFRTGACPEGYDLKKGYKRKGYIKKNGTVVKGNYIDPVCVPDKGLPGKLASKYKVIKINENHPLRPFRYSPDLPADKRFAILLKAASVISYKTVISTINAFRTLTKANKELYHIYTEDIKRMQEWRKENPDLYKNKNNKKDIKPKKNNNIKKNITINIKRKTPNNKSRKMLVGNKIAVNKEFNVIKKMNK